jgi:hypothetical protein
VDIGTIPIIKSANHNVAPVCVFYSCVAMHPYVHDLHSLRHFTCSECRVAHCLLSVSLKFMLQVASADDEALRRRWGIRLVVH